MIQLATSKPLSEVSLDRVSGGQKVQIVRIEAGCDLKNRLAAMGFLADETIEVIRNDRRGQVIIAVKSSKVVLGRGMSQKIFVQ
jgi:Fe2+ transport system protein FeoA